MIIATKEKAQEVINALMLKKEKTKEEIELLKVAISFLANNGLKTL